MALDKGVPTERELWEQRRVADKKNLLALIERDWSASRMNATRWSEMMAAEKDLNLWLRLK